MYGLCVCTLYTLMFGFGDKLSRRIDGILTVWMFIYSLNEIDSFEFGSWRSQIYRRIRYLRTVQSTRRSRNQFQFFQRFYSICNAKSMHKRWSLWSTSSLWHRIIRFIFHCMEFVKPKRIMDWTKKMKDK